MPEFVTWLFAALAVVFLLVAVAAIVAWNNSRADVGRAQKLADEKAKTAEDKAQVAIREVEAQRKEMILQAKDQSHQIRAEVETEYRERRADLQRQERRMQQKE